jgi:hypothetical protein
VQAAIKGAAERGARMTRPEFIAQFSEYEDYRTAMPMSASEWDCFQALRKAQEMRRVCLNQHKKKSKPFAPLPLPAEDGDRFGAMRRRIAELDEKIAERGHT